MPETNDFINKLLSKNNDELDDILSYADNRKSDSNISHIKTEDADAILKEFDMQNNTVVTDPMEMDIKKPVNADSNLEKKASTAPHCKKATVGNQNTKKNISHISVTKKSSASDRNVSNNVLNSLNEIKDTDNDNKVKIPVTSGVYSEKNEFDTQDTTTDQISVSDSESAKKITVSKKTDLQKPVLTDTPVKKANTRTKASSKNISVSTVPHNFHHILLQPEICEYISYKSICDNQPVNTSLIPEETRKINIIEPQEEIEKLPKADKNPPPKPVSDEPEQPDPDISSTERFLLQQEEKHPRVYFAIGISIFVLTLLGLASCIYLGLNAMKSFTKNYNETTVTSYYENNTDSLSLICEKSP